MIYNYTVWLDGKVYDNYFSLLKANGDMLFLKKRNVDSVVEIKPYDNNTLNEYFF